MIAICMDFFSNVLAKLRASRVLSVMPKTLWWRQNEVPEKSAQHSIQLVRQELVMVSPKVTLQNSYEIDHMFSHSVCCFFTVDNDDDYFYIALFSTLEQTHYARMWFYMSD